MATNNNAGRKTGPGNQQTDAAQATEAAGATRRDNLFSRHGNQQIAEVIQQARQEQQGNDASLLAAVENEQQGPEQVQSPSWAQDEANAEQLQRVARNSSDAAQIVNGMGSEHLEALDKARQQAGRELTQVEVLLAVATTAEVSEEKKAEMLLAQDEKVDSKLLEGQSGELRALVVAEELPPLLATYAKAAAGDVTDKPLSERDTIKNLMDRVMQIARRLHSHPSLTDSTASIEEKATRLVELVSYELDIPTLESVAAYPFAGLVEDMVFAPRGLMEINRLSSNRREVRAMGSFGVVLWQRAYDAVRDRLKRTGRTEQIHEAKFLEDVWCDMAMQMFTDATSDPWA